MPRMLANEFIYSSSTADERYNEYITPTSPLYHQQTQSMPQQHLNHNHNQSNVALTASTSLEEQRNLKSRSSHSPTQQFTQSSDSGQNTSPEMLQQQQQQRIHFISASDAGEEAIPIITDKPITTQIVASVSSDDLEDFEGFDEDIEAENNAILQTQYQDDGEFHGRGLLKRHSQADYQEYHEDSEGVVEAIEVDDDEDIEEVDGQCLFRLRREKTPVNTLNRYAVDCNPHTPNKRKKCQNEGEGECTNIQLRFLFL